MQHPTALALPAALLGLALAAQGARAVDAAPSAAAAPAASAKRAAPAQQATARGGVAKVGAATASSIDAEATGAEAAKTGPTKDEAAKPARARKTVRKTSAKGEGGAPARAPTALDGLIAAHAAANGVPEGLVHRVVMRESRYNPRAIGRGGVFGLMQLKHGTARALGYAGGAAGLLDPATNLTYGVKYLAGAYRVADGDHDRAVAFFARGYYYEAKRRGLAGPARIAPAAPVEVAEAAAPPDPEPAVAAAWESNR